MNCRADRAGCLCGWITLVLFAGLLCASCSGRPKVYPVTGRVLHKGRPAAGARVVFHPSGTTDPQAPRPLATVQADGSFTLASYGQGDGAAVGDYTVTVVWPSQASRTATGSAVDRLHGAYSDPARSPLRARVVEGQNALEPFDLR
jgi:hypothetical protein